MLDKSHLYSVIVGAVATIFVGLFTYDSAVFTAKTTQLDVAYQRIKTLEQTNAGLQAKIIELSAKISMLESQVLNSGLNTPEEAVKDFLDAFPLPAWAKRWHEEAQEFRMVHINRAYEAFYGITQAAYEGTTDFETHEDQIARAFYANDMAVLVKKGSDMFQEVVRKPNGQLVTLQFVKFYVRMPDGAEWIAGVQVEK